MDIANAEKIEAKPGDIIHIRIPRGYLEDITAIYDAARNTFPLGVFLIITPDDINIERLGSDDLRKLGLARIQ